MCPLRRRSAQLLIVASMLPLAAFGGCAMDAARISTGSAGAVPHAAAAKDLLPHPLRAILLGDGSLSENEAEMVIAQATAQHEMRRP